jgi:hypothetical protein
MAKNIERAPEAVEDLRLVVNEKDSLKRVHLVLQEACG